MVLLLKKSLTPAPQSGTIVVERKVCPITELTAIRDFVELITGIRPVIARKRDDWSVVSEADSMRMTVPTVYTSSETDKAFRKDFVSRCPLARGFADVTISILHEMGHFATRDNFNADVYTAQVEEAGADMEKYMAIPYEMLATCWAICWLMDPDNRKEAKNFERNFFGRG